MIRKYRRIRIYMLVLIFILSNLIVPGEVHKAQAATIYLSNTSYTLEVNHYKTLSVIGTGRTVTWSSSNKLVATVTSGGRVTAKSAGTAYIYASAAGKKLSCKITVIKISQKTLSLYPGDKKKLSVTGTLSTVTWSSDNKSAVTVSSSGTITAKAAGTATITAAVDGKKLSCIVTVKASTAAAVSPSVTPAVTLSPAPVVTPDPTITSVPAITPAPVTSSAPVSRIIGYYAAWARYSGFTPDKIDAGKLTTINYAFANIGSDLKIELGYPDIDAANISQLNELKKVNPDLKTIISVGGWDWSGRFSDVALTDVSRNTFADSCVEFIIKYGFDGVDIDWEYPVRGGLNTNINRPEDKYNFTLLLQTLRDKLDAQGAADGKKYILSFAGAAGSWYLNNIEPSQISRYVDYMNLMTYDIHGSWESCTNFNAPLYSDKLRQQSDNNTSSDASVKIWIAEGFQKDKIIMGVPFYGYIYKAVNDANAGLYQSFSGAASISYANVAGNYLNASGYTRYFSADTQIPWLFNGSTFISYEDEQSMALKAGYIRDNSLGGAMIWELSQDPKAILLKALYNGLNN